MIKGIQGGPGVLVAGGDTSLQYVSPDANNPMQGMVRVSGTDLQVFNGSYWQNIATSYASVSLTPDTMRLLEWARKKQDEEQSIWVSPNEHPAVKIAKENLNKAKAEVARVEEQLKITVILSKDEETTS